MINFLNIALALVSQFSVAVLVPGSDMARYGMNQEISLPTDKYTCHTEADRDDKHDVVQVICQEKGRDVFNFATVCYNTEQDKNVATFKLNVSKTKTPQYVLFLVGCRTVPDGTTTL